MYPEYFLEIVGADDPVCSAPRLFGEWLPYTGTGAPRECPTRDRAQERFFEEVERRGMAEAHIWLRKQDAVRSAVRWSIVYSTTTWVKKDVAIAYEDALDAGKEP